MRLVLDSNVWLDWLFFNDPGVAGIKRAHREGRIEIVVDAACRDELVRVLGYRQFALDPPGQASALAAADRLWTFLDTLDYPPPASLPFCSDPDDIKFLALASASQADWLITKDKALLGKVRQRKRDNAPYRIVTPQQWDLSQQQA